MMGMCLISSELLDPKLDGHLRRLTDSTPLASLMRRRLAARLGVDATREAVGSARLDALREQGTSYLQGLWQEAGLAAIVVDEGYRSRRSRRASSRRPPGCRCIAWPASSRGSTG